MADLEERFTYDEWFEATRWDSLTDNPPLPLVAQAMGDFGFDPILDGVQFLTSTEIQWAADQAPFDGGLIVATPFAPILIVFERHLAAPEGAEFFIHPHGPAVAAFIARHLQSSTAMVHLVEAEGRRLVSVADLPGAGLPDYLYVPASDEFGTAVSDPRAMQRITARLRRPDGCPWDRKQTHESLAKNFVDEVYEVVDAIESGDPAAIAEELGDLFLLIMMQAQIGHEAGTFSIEDVYAGIARKIVGRHPHVFGEAVVETDADLSGVWAAAKEQELAEGRKHGGKDIDGEPFSMPALTRATRVLSKYPVAADDNIPEFLRIVGEIVARGEDPDKVLKRQLHDHVSRQSTAS